MTTPVRVLVFGETPGADRVAEAALRCAGWIAVVAARPDTPDLAPAIGGGAWDVAVVCDAAACRGETCAFLRAIRLTPGGDVPVIVVLPDGRERRARPT